jgi:hypothetical protein
MAANAGWGGAPIMALRRALLRCADPGQAESLAFPINWPMASSSTVTASRRLMGCSTASS